MGLEISSISNKRIPVPTRNLKLMTPKPDDKMYSKPSRGELFSDEFFCPFLVVKRIISDDKTTGLTMLDVLTIPPYSPNLAYVDPVLDSLECNNQFRERLLEECVNVNKAGAYPGIHASTIDKKQLVEMSPVVLFEECDLVLGSDEVNGKDIDSKVEEAIEEDKVQNEKETKDSQSINLSSNLRGTDMFTNTSQPMLIDVAAGNSQVEMLECAVGTSQTLTTECATQTSQDTLKVDSATEIMGELSNSFKKSEGGIQPTPIVFPRVSKQTSGPLIPTKIRRMNDDFMIAPIYSASSVTYNFCESDKENHRIDFQQRADRCNSNTSFEYQLPTLLCSNFNQTTKQEQMNANAKDENHDPAPNESSLSTSMCGPGQHLRVGLSKKSRSRKPLHAKVFGAERFGV